MMQRLRNFLDVITAPQNRIALLAASFILLALAARTEVDEVLLQFRMVPIDLFVGPRDVFADLLKSGFSYRFISDAYMRSGQYLAWPDVYKVYLLHNPYNGPALSNLWMPPLTAMILMVAAKMVGIVGPTKTVAIFFVLYGCGVSAICIGYRKLTRATSFDAVALALVLMLSYPAIFMLSRGNLPSGFTTLCLCFYSFSVVSRRLRWLGWLALGLAVNMRPNVAVFALIEFAAALDIRRAIPRVVLAAMASILVLGLCHLFVTSVYAEYSLSAFFAHLKVYNQIYVVDGGGDEWNSSLFSVVKEIRLFLNLASYSAVWMQLVLLLGTVLMGAILFLLARRRLTILETAFLVAMFCSNFTPVFATYHLLEYAAVLGLVLADCRDGRGLAAPNRQLILVSTVLVLCPLGGALTNGAICAVQTLVAGLLLLARAFRRTHPIPAGSNAD